MSEANNPTSAFVEAVNSVNSETYSANISFFDSPNETVIVPTSQAKKPHSVNFYNGNKAPDNSECCLPYPNLIEVSENGMAMLAPSELAELIALIEEVHSSNSDLVQQVTELTAQLENSQQRVAQLERECSLTQASYNEQSHQLVQVENTCRELRSRLTRQQRHTLQFKVALEKCLEVPVPNYQSQVNTEWESGDLRDTPCLPPFLPQAQPIPPWSAPPQFIVNELSAWEPLSSTLSPDSFWEWSVDDLSTPLEEEPLATVETDDASTPQEESASPIATFSHNETKAVLLKVEQTEGKQLDAAMPMFDPLSSPQSDELPSTTGEFQPSESDINEAQLQDLVSLLAELEKPVTVDTNWPSVVVYPLRPPKGRKSLAEIALPRFA